MVRGSPPRAWGQSDRSRSHSRTRGFTPTCVGTILTVELLLQLESRFTPTCVGTMRNGLMGIYGPKVHPHVRGDNCNPVAGHGFEDGSPPRAWGQLGPHHIDAPDIAVHPHVRGDNATRGSLSNPNSGSPPRAWGQLSLSLMMMRRGSVHPHVRGDNPRPCLWARSTDGSPPRAWGQWSHVRNRPGLARFTPTCVGTMGM